MSPGHYIGLDRTNPYAAHNAGIPADAEADVCRCPACASPFTAGGVRRGPAEVIAFARDPLPARSTPGPVAASPLPAAGPGHRGPVQDESGALDPIDRAAMQAIEGWGDDDV